jgi:hypothetical protein
MDVDIPSTSGWTEVPLDALLVAPSSTTSAVNIDITRLRSSTQAFYGNSHCVKSKKLEGNLGWNSVRILCFTGDSNRIPGWNVGRTGVNRMDGLQEDYE